MSVITGVKQQKLKGRVNVYIDDEFSFGIDLDNFVLLGLRVGQNLTPDEIEKAKNTSDFGKTLEKVYRFAMVRLRSEKEFTDYFKRKKIDSTFHPRLLKKLRQLNLLNDEEFARAWSTSRLKKKSLKIVKLELQQKGINRNIIEDVLSEVKIDDFTLAKNLIEKRMYRYQNLDPKTRKLKISQFLAGKGFDWNIIEKIAKNS